MKPSRDDTKALAATSNRSHHMKKIIDRPQPKPLVKTNREDIR